MFDRTAADRREELIVVGSAACAGAGYLALALAGLDPPDVLLLLAAAIAYGCGRFAGLWLGVGATAALCAGMAAGGDSAVPFAICTAVPWAVGRTLLSRAELVSALQVRQRQIEIEQDTLARLSVSHERARIARELHDIVAHHLAAIVIQAGAGRISPDDSDATERFARIRQSSNEALQEMSHLVDLLRPDDDQSRPPGLDSLLDTAQAAGLTLNSEGLSLSPSLDPGVERLAYRIVQEGLTNAMKHAPGSEVTLRVSVGLEKVEIDLRDDGARKAPTLASAGSQLGLAGLRSRLESLGGSLDAGPSAPHGWRLRARVPTN